MKHYFYPVSRGATTAWMLKELDVPHEEIVIDFRAGDQNAPQIGRTSCVLVQRPSNSLCKAMAGTQGPPRGRGGTFFSVAPTDRFGETPLRKRALQFRHLHKNGGFKRYGMLALESLRERLV